LIRGAIDGEQLIWGAIDGEQLMGSNWWGEIDGEELSAYRREEIHYYNARAAYNLPHVDSSFVGVQEALA